MAKNIISDIVALSNTYGADPKYVLAGGGNTSAKDNQFLWVKPSGVPLATMQAEHLVKMDRKTLDAIMAANYSKDPVAREAEVKAAMMSTICAGSIGRPSVEAPLHNLFDAALVVHTHPALVNGLTCSVNGEKECKKLFPDALWVPYADPGFVLAANVKLLMADHRANHGKQPRCVFLQNHGVFVAANTVAEINEAYAGIMAMLEGEYQKAGVSMELTTGTLDEGSVMAQAPALRILLSDADRLVVVSSAPFAVAQGPLTPDHIVYAKSYAHTDVVSTDAIDTFIKRYGYRPVVVAQPGAVFAAGTTLKNATTAMDIAKDGALVQQLAKAYGGPRYLDDRARLFIENWEVENYRRSVSVGRAKGRLEGKIAVVTGGAQGFGQGIAERLAAEGALVLVSDINLDGAQAVVDQIVERQGEGSACAVKVDVGDEASVQAMMQQIVLRCGGIDLFIANAGVLRAGSVKTLPLADWECVTRVNYTGYFLCVKHASVIMASQNVAGRGSWMDIVQINSKSGLEGSNRNAAYAGSKFGGIGLTQSFAKELIADRIKVNAICPGNYYEGPLWSDPERGLFRQYLDSGKVPGAATIDEIKRHYERQVPMGRGCLPEDVVRAILYCVEQQYETGQAIPVCGGQVMLK